MRAQEAAAPASCGEGAEGWWAIYTKHQHEKTAAEILTARGAEVFLPLYQSLRRWKDRRVQLALPLFPCYLFVRAQPAVRVPVVSTPGIHMIVSQGGKHALVSAAEIEQLRRALQTPQRVQPHPYLRTGERVRVARGPLEGLEGILVRQKNLSRVVISVDMLARSAAVEINAWDVVPAPAGRPGGALLQRPFAPPGGLPRSLPPLQTRVLRTTYEEIHETS